MKVRRRGVFLATCFALLSSLLASSVSSAQQPPTKPHPVWGSSLSTEQMKGALARLGKGEGDLDPFQKQLAERILKMQPELENNPQLLEKFLSNKPLVERFRKMFEENQGKAGQPAQLEELQGELKQFLKDNELPKLPGAGHKGVTQPPPATKENPQTGPGPNEPGPGFSKKPMPMTEPPTKFNPPHLPPPHNRPPAPANPDVNPFGRPDEPSDPRTKSLSALTSLWEKNVGPLDETPELKRAFFELVSGDNGFDFDIKDENGGSFWDWVKNGDGGSFAEAMKGDGGGDWNLPKFDLPDVNVGKWFGNSSSKGGNSLPSSPGGGGLPSLGGSGGFGGTSGTGNWPLYLLLGLVILGAILVSWWHLRNSSPDLSGTGKGLGPWPIDPRAINTREDVVKAFDYLSVLICGPAAKMWTHGTIAESLSNLAISHAEPAMKLARLYELARYAPLDEPLSRHEVIEARHLVCDLAGVS